MPRRLGIEYPGAIYHLMARGNGRQDIVSDDLDRERLLTGLERSVTRTGWRLCAFVVLSKHLHLVVKTARPNLARGMQNFLSSYANLWARRHRFVVRVFQGRYRAELVEDETYLWTLTRYVHRNPVRARLVDDPAEWTWSSYPGYARPRRRRDWVWYDEFLSAWDGAWGGRDPASSYRRFVTAGVKQPPPSPCVTTSAQGDSYEPKASG
jgi:putative transposase